MEQKISKGRAEVIDLVMPGQTNHYGTMFGGLLVAQMDKAANIAATRYCQNNCVTVNIDNIVFENPVKLGETIIAKARLIYVGKSSLLLRVSAQSEDKQSRIKTIICCADFIFVSVDKNGKPTQVPKPILETEEEKKLFAHGKKVKDLLLNHHKIT